MALTQTSTTVTTVGGFGWCAIPAGGLSVVNAVAQFVADASRISTHPLADSANEAGRFNQANDTPLPVFMGASPTAIAGFAPQGLIQFGPGPGGPAPDGTYSVIIWAA